MPTVLYGSLRPPLSIPPIAADRADHRPSSSEAREPVCGGATPATVGFSDGTPGAVPPCRRAAILARCASTGSVASVRGPGTAGTPGTGAGAGTRAGAGTPAVGGTSGPGRARRGSAVRWAISAFSDCASRFSVMRSPTASPSEVRPSPMFLGKPRFCIASALATARRRCKSASDCGAAPPMNDAKLRLFGSRMPLWAGNGSAMTTRLLLVAEDRAHPRHVDKLGALDRLDRAAIDLLDVLRHRADVAHRGGIVLVLVFVDRQRALAVGAGREHGAELGSDILFAPVRARQARHRAEDAAHDLVEILAALLVVRHVLREAVVGQPGIVGGRDLARRGVGPCRLLHLRPRHQRADLVDRRLPLRVLLAQKLLARVVLGVELGLRHRHALALRRVGELRAQALLGEVLLLRGVGERRLSLRLLERLLLRRVLEAGALRRHVVEQLLLLTPLGRDAEPRVGQLLVEQLLLRAIRLAAGEVALVAQLRLHALAIALELRRHALVHRLLDAQAIGREIIRRAVIARDRTAAVEVAQLLVVRVAVAVGEREAGERVGVARARRDLPAAGATLHQPAVAIVLGGVGGPRPCQIRCSAAARRRAGRPRRPQSRR